MLKKVLFISLLICIFYVNLSYSQTIREDYNDYSYYSRNNGYGYEDNYCSPQKSFFTRLKEAFIGTPTGFTPPLLPSTYLNSYGPSYMRGFYGNNGWNSHNIYSPMVTGAGVHILD